MLTTEKCLNFLKYKKPPCVASGFLMKKDDTVWIK